MAYVGGAFNQRRHPRVKHEQLLERVGGQHRGVVALEPIGRVADAVPLALLDAAALRVPRAHAKDGLPLAQHLGVPARLVVETWKQRLDFRGGLRRACPEASEVPGSQGAS